MKEFNLSEKISEEFDAITKEDVQKFIRLLKEEYKKDFPLKHWYLIIDNVIDKIAGDKLI